MRTYKTCTKCKKRKWIGKFRGLKEISPGNIRWHPWCKECERRRK